MIELAWFLYSSGFLAVGIIFLFFAKKLFDWMTPYSVEIQLSEKDNPAMGILLAGFLAGELAVICGAFAGDGGEVPTLQSFAREILPVAIYAVAGMFLLFAAGMLNDKVVFTRFTHQMVIDERNSAAALVMGSNYLASGLIIAGGIYGNNNYLSFLASFAVGQIVLNGFALIYLKCIRYDGQAEVFTNRNLAAAFAMSGNLIAYSLILMKGVQTPLGQNISWSDRGLHFLYYLVSGMVLLLISRLLADRIFLPKTRLRDEIIRDRNLNAGLLEGIIAVSLGIILVFCL